MQKTFNPFSGNFDFVGKPNTAHKHTIDDITNLESRLWEIEMHNAGEISWAELKNLRDTRNLKPRVWYRITDYHCTTTQAGTRSADNQFDILVYALSADQLSENAKAVNHTVFNKNTRRYEPNPYFSQTNFNAWELKYCLDNDDQRFLWACQKISEYPCVEIGWNTLQQITPLNNETTAALFGQNKGGDFGFKKLQYFWGIENDNRVFFTDNENPQEGDRLYAFESGFRYTYIGQLQFQREAPTPQHTGVIYYMKDEFNNEAPYDFKNIQFNIAGPGEPEKFVYTFWHENTYDGEPADRSVKTGNPDSPFYPANNNCIKPLFVRMYLDYIYTNLHVQKLNAVTMGEPQTSSDHYDCVECNFVDYNCEDIQLNGLNNNIGSSCYNIIANCGKSSIGKGSYDIRITDGTNIKIGDDCIEIRLFDDNREICIGNNCYYINTHDDCHGINIGNRCSYINFTGEIPVRSVTIGNGAMFLKIFEAPENPEAPEESELNYGLGRVVVQDFLNRVDNTWYLNLVCPRNHTQATEFKNMTLATEYPLNQ